MKKSEINELVNCNREIAIVYNEWKKTNPYRDNDIKDIYCLGGFNGKTLYVYIKYKKVNKMFTDEYTLNEYNEIVKHEITSVTL